MSDELKTKIDWSCRFAKHKYEIYEGCLRIVEHTNLAYVEPHKVIINIKGKSYRIKDIVQEDFEHQKSS